MRDHSRGYLGVNMRAILCGAHIVCVGGAAENTMALTTARQYWWTVPCTDTYKVGGMVAYPSEASGIKAMLVYVLDSAESTVDIRLPSAPYC